MFLTAQSGDLFAGGRSSCEGYTEIFMAYLAAFSQVDNLVMENTQKNFQKFWFQRVSRLTLATCTRLKSVTKIVCFAQISQFLKLLCFHSNFCDYSLSSPFLPLLNSPSHSRKTSICSSFQLQSSRKRYGFSYSHNIFHVLCLGFLDL